jgi:hypothetical protein
MTTPDPITDEELNQLNELASAAAPGPWYMRALDDQEAMSLVAVSTVPDTGRGERWPTSTTARSWQQPSSRTPATFTRPTNAGTRTPGSSPPPAKPVPLLVDEIRRLRAQLDASHPKATEER